MNKTENKSYEIEDITDCQILYFSGSFGYSKNAATVKQKLGGKNSLIITESEGAINDGSIINFVIRDDKLKFELSQKNADVFAKIIGKGISILFLSISIISFSKISLKEIISGPIHSIILE